MKVNEIGNTCTMIEIGDLYYDEISSKTKLFRSINVGLRLLKKPILLEDTYMVMYNGTCKEAIKKLKRLGFKKVSSYQGHSQNRVQVLMWEPNKLSFYQRFIEKYFY